MNKLCEGIKETHEFTKIQEAKKKLSADKDAEAMVKDFLQQKSQLELLQYQGKKPDEEAVKKMQKLYEVLQLNPVANEYIQNYIRFQMMIGDLSKTWGIPLRKPWNDEHRALLAYVREHFPNRYGEKVPMAQYTSFHIGGPADLLVAPESVDELQGLLKEAKKSLFRPLSWETAPISLSGMAGFGVLSSSSAIT